MVTAHRTLWKLYRVRERTPNYPRGSDGGPRGASMIVSGPREIVDFSKKLKKNSIQVNPKVFLDLSQDADAHGTKDCLVL